MSGSEMQCNGRSVERCWGIWVSGRELSILIGHVSDNVVKVVSQSRKKRWWDSRLMGGRSLSLFQFQYAKK